MAIFGKKKSGDEGQDGATPNTVVVEQSSEKAKRFFDRAKTVHDSQQFEFAILLWLDGLKWDPTDLGALEKFALSASAFLGQGSGKVSKETVRNLEGKRLVDRYVLALLQWGVKPRDATSVVKAAEAAAKIDAESALDMSEVMFWIGERALAIIRSDKPKKDHYVRLMNACRTARVYDLAVAAGDEGVRLDPTDANLAAATRNLAAQATMSTGGYAETGEAGGFRANIKDAGQQRIVEERERIVKTEDVKDRLVQVGEEEYARRPDDLPTVRQYVKALKERGREDDEKLAYRLLMKAFEESKQFQLKVDADDVKLRQARRTLMKYRDAAEENPDNSAAQENLKKADRRFVEMEVESLRAQVEAYPTDLRLKYELGRRELKLDNHDEAIALFQESQHDPKYRSTSLALLGESFFRQDWVDEAIDTYKRAIEGHDDSKDTSGLDLRYGLMCALQRKAREETDLDAAIEADKLASGIAIQQINYRDIKAQRNELKKLVSELKQRQVG